LNAPATDAARVLSGPGDIAARQFETLQAVVRDWSRYRRISELQGFGWTGSANEEGERFTRLWVSADRRIREELDTGDVRYGGIEDAGNWPLLKPDWLANAADLVYLGARQVGGRDGHAFEASEPAGFLLPGSDRTVGVFDAERAVLLRAEAWRHDDLLMIEEMTDVLFDAPLDAALFWPN
jgi:hypothetical protein